MILATALALPGRAQAQEPDSRSETYGQWTVQCETTETAQQCWMAQQVRDDNGNRLVQLEVGILGDQPRMVLIAPFGLLLAEGAGLVIDGTPLQTLSVRTCLPAGCLFNAEPDAAFLGAFREGETLTIRLVAVEGSTPFNVELGLAGFAGAYDRLSALVAD